MSLNFALNIGYLIQNGVYNHNAENNPAAQLITAHSSCNLKVITYPRWYKHIAVEWSVPVDWGNCLFNVYFCENEEGPFERLNGAPLDNTFLLDSETQEFSKFNKGYYIVEAILLDRSSVRIKSEPSTWDTSQHRWVEIRSTEIQRREHILLTKFAGIKTYLFRKKTYGERCPECWDTHSGKSIKDRCTTCFGSTFKGGYFPPAPLFMQYEPTPNANMKMYFGIFEPNQIGAWTIAFPEIFPDDIIIRSGDWSLYRVDRTADTELQGKAVRQIIVLTELPKNNTEQQLFAKLPDFPDQYK